jgi:hypothetical protein
MYGSKKNIRNSVLTEFRGHPTAAPSKRRELFFSGLVLVNALETFVSSNVGSRVHIRVNFKT